MNIIIAYEQDYWEIIAIRKDKFVEELCKAKVKEWNKRLNPRFKNMISLLERRILWIRLYQILFLKAMAQKSSGMKFIL